MSQCRLTFVTGTDTGAGKTVTTALLLAHLRQRGFKALAIKPFCSGNRSDPALLQALQDHELSISEINPFFFPEPVAPLVAARKQHQQIPLKDVLKHVSAIGGRCEQLLIEGVGGLLVPLGEGYSVLDLIQCLKPTVIVVARNKLGTLNHTLLTVERLRAAAIRSIKVALADTRTAAPATVSNAKILIELLAPTPVFHLPFLGPQASRVSVIRRSSVRLSRMLSRVLR